MAKKKTHRIKHTAEAMVGLAGLAAAVAGTYFLYGPKGDKNRKMVKSWMLSAKAEALEKLENLKEMNEDTYHKVVDEVTTRYQKMPHVDKAELKNLEKELRGYWKDIKKHKLLKKSN